MNSLTQLPGGELMAKGLLDLAAGQVTAEACLIAIARGRLSRAGLAIPPHADIAEPEHRLYALLGAEPGDAYSRYNALIRQLISFAQTLEHQRARAPAAWGANATAPW